MSQRTNSGSSYWVSQIIGAVFLIAIGFGFGAYIFAKAPDDAGLGLIMMLTGFAGLGLLFWAIRQMSKTTKVQRAIFAWAVTQQNSSRWSDWQAGVVPNDVVALNIAAKARDGKLGRAEILSLQALRPDNIYPATLPPSSGIPTSLYGSQGANLSRKPEKQRSGAAKFFRKVLFSFVALLIVAGLAAAGVGILRSGLDIREDAIALEHAEGSLISAVGTVKEGDGITDSPQITVSFVTESGESVETWVWTRSDSAPFHVGDSVPLAYVSQRPSAARLTDGRADAPNSFSSICWGVSFLASALALAWGFWGGSLNNRRKPRLAGPDSGLAGGSEYL